MSERDPKLDPRAGDVLRKGKRTKAVIGRDEWRGPWVNYQTPTGERNGLMTAERLEWWHKWARTAEVVRAEEEK
jgi:hypothetical protein